MDKEFDFFTIMPEDKVPEAGKILISEPFLSDFFFNRTIVYLTSHSHEGSVGFVLNRYMLSKVSETIPGLEKWDEPLSMGGPVSTDTLHFLHSLGNAIPNSVKIKDNIYWGGDVNMVKELINEGKAPKNSIRFFLGYSGWEAGQLERELNEDSWVIAKINPKNVLQNKDNDLWTNVLRGLKSKYRVWADLPKYPELN